MALLPAVELPGGLYLCPIAGFVRHLLHLRPEVKDGLTAIAVAKRVELGTIGRKSEPSPAFSHHCAEPPVTPGAPVSVLVRVLS
jgi:hypothetical protein